MYCITNNIFHVILTTENIRNHDLDFVFLILFTRLFYKDLLICINEKHVNFTTSRGKQETCNLSYIALVRRIHFRIYCYTCIKQHSHFNIKNICYCIIKTKQKYMTQIYDSNMIFYLNSRKDVSSETL